MILGWGAPGQAAERQDPGTAQLPQPHPCCGGLGLGWGDQSLASWEAGAGKDPGCSSRATEPRRSWCWCLCVGGGAAVSCQAGLVGRIRDLERRCWHPGRRGAPGSTGGRGAAPAPAGKFLKEGALWGCISWQGCRGGRAEAGGWRDTWEEADLCPGKKNLNSAGQRGVKAAPL